MAVVDSVMTGLHLLFAGLWTGSVLFVAYAVVPTAGAGEMDAAPLEILGGKLKTVSRASAVVLFLTGGHLAGTQYTVGTLTGTTRGYLVIAMIALWLVLMGLVEVGSGTLVDGANRKKVRQPAKEARPFFLGAAAVAVLLLIDAGLLAGGL